MAKPSVLLVFSEPGVQFATAIREELCAEADVILWSRGASAAGRAIFDSLANAAARADLAVLVVGSSFSEREAERPAERLNEILSFEFGYLLGTLGPQRALVLSVASDPIVPPPKYLVAGNILEFASVAHFITRRDKTAQFWLPTTAGIIRSMLKQVGLRQKPVNYYSCFISYSASDQDFVNRIYGDLHNVGVPCWLDTKDLRIGHDIARQIDRAIRLQDRVLVVLSRSSISSEWVEHEIEQVLKAERAGGGIRLFPVRLDDSVLGWTGSRTADKVRARHIADFTNWMDDEAYRKEFKRLVRDLSVASSQEAQGRTP